MAAVSGGGGTNLIKKELNKQLSEALQKKFKPPSENAINSMMATGTDFAAVVSDKATAKDWIDHNISSLTFLPQDEAEDIEILLGIKADPTNNKKTKVSEADFITTVSALKELIRQEAEKAIAAKKAAAAPAKVAVAEAPKPTAAAPAAAGAGAGAQDVAPTPAEVAKSAPAKAADASAPAPDPTAGAGAGKPAHLPKPKIDIHAPLKTLL